jgi:putative transposon-encoded protein
MKHFVLALFAAAALLAADVSGTWDLEVDIAGNTGSPVFTLKQEGAKLTGTYAGAFGEAPVTGTVDGNKIVMKFEVAPQGDKVTLTYEGTVKADGKSMEGKIDVPGFGAGTFKGSKR